MKTIERSTQDTDTLRIHLDAHLAPITDGLVSLDGGASSNAREAIALTLGVLSRIGRKLSADASSADQDHMIAVQDRVRLQRASQGASEALAQALTSTRGSLTSACGREVAHLVVPKGPIPRSNARVVPCARRAVVQLRDDGLPWTQRLGGATLDRVVLARQLEHLADVAEAAWEALTAHDAELSKLLTKRTVDEDRLEHARVGLRRTIQGLLLIAQGPKAQAERPAKRRRRTKRHVADPKPPVPAPVTPPPLPPHED